MNKKIMVKIIMLFVVQSVSLVAFFYDDTLDHVTRRIFETADAKGEKPVFDISPYKFECLNDNQKSNVLPFIDNLKKKERGDFDDEDRSLFEKIDFRAKPILIMGAVSNEISSIELKRLEAFKEELDEMWIKEIIKVYRFKFEVEGYVKNLKKEIKEREEKRIQEERSKKNSYCELDKSLKLGIHNDNTKQEENDEEIDRLRKEQQLDFEESGRYCLKAKKSGRKIAESFESFREKKRLKKEKGSTCSCCVIQ